MSKIKSSILWTVSKEQYYELITNSETLSELLRKINVVPHGGNVHTLKKVLTEYNLDYSKFNLGLSHNKGKKLIRKLQISNDILYASLRRYYPVQVIRVWRDRAESPKNRHLSKAPLAII